MDFLASRPSLHVLKVELSHLKVAMTLERMLNLREISLTENYRYRSTEPIRVQTYNNLAKLLALCSAPQIKKLSVVKLTSLHEILPALEPLRLKDLRMTRSFIKLDSLTTPHLRHLTCLRLLNMNIPGSGELEKAEQEGRIGSKMNDFWLALQRSGVYLKEIKVGNINDGLLVYLTRYTGLTKLGVSTAFSKSLPEPDVPARLFFAEPLASHVETLEELDVRAGFEDTWCFGEHNMSAFSSCAGLKKLAVSVSKADLSNALGEPDIVVSSRVRPE